MDVIDRRMLMGRVLASMASGGLPTGIAEITTGTYYNENRIFSNTFDIQHKMSTAPDIIVMWSDYETRFTSQDPAPYLFIVGEYYNAKQGNKIATYVPTNYAGGTQSTNALTVELDSTNTGHIVAVTDSVFTLKAYTNRQFGYGLTYKWIAIRLN